MAVSRPAREHMSKEADAKTRKHRDGAHRGGGMDGGETQHGGRAQKMRRYEYRRAAGSGPPTADLSL